MPTDLSRLRVSLTKHGAHKIAYLIKEFDKDDILNHLNGDYKDIRISDSQTRAILSINSNGIAPDLWNNIKEYGIEDINDLVFLAIIFSHIDYINAIRTSFTQDNTIYRSEFPTEKVYTNLAHIIEQLGYAVNNQHDFIVFDLARIFYKFYLPPLIIELLQIKLHSAGWENINALYEECINLDINSVLDCQKMSLESGYLKSVR